MIKVLLQLPIYPSRLTETFNEVASYLDYPRKMNHQIYLPRTDVDFCYQLLDQLTDRYTGSMIEEIQSLSVSFLTAEAHPEYPDIFIVETNRDMAYRFGLVLCASASLRCRVVGITIIRQIEYIVRMS